VFGILTLSLSAIDSNEFKVYAFVAVIHINALKKSISYMYHVL
jgi:hypothetical protein